MEFKYSCYFSVLLLGLLATCYADDLLHRKRRVIWLDREEKDGELKPDSITYGVKNTKIGNGTNEQQRPKKWLEKELEDQEERIKNKEIADQRITEVKDTVTEKVIKTKIGQDKSSLQEDIQTELLKQYCTIRYKTSHLQQCLSLCLLHQIIRDNFTDIITSPPQQPITTSQGKNETIIQTDQKYITDQEKPTRTGQKIHRPQSKGRIIKQIDKNYTQDEQKPTTKGHFHRPEGKGRIITRIDQKYTQDEQKPTTKGHFHRPQGKDGITTQIDQKYIQEEQKSTTKGHKIHHSQSKDRIISQTDYEYIHEKEKPAVKGQNVQHLIQQFDIRGKTSPTQYPTKYLKRSKRWIENLANLIQHQHIYGVQFDRLGFESYYIDPYYILKGTAEANGLTYDELDRIVSVIESSALYRRATLIAKPNSGYSGTVVVHF